MLPTGLEFSKLVAKLSKVPPERAAALGIIYLLLDPKAPALLSQNISERPELLSPAHCFHSNLALGLTDTALEYRSENERNNLTRKVFRQLAGLSSFEKEHAAIYDFLEPRYWALFRSYHSTCELLSERELRNMELAIFVEDLIRALSEQRAAITALLYYRLRESVKRASYQRLARRVEHTVQEAWKNSAAEQAELLANIDAPIRFSGAAYSDPEFKNAAHTAEKLLRFALLQ